LTAKRPYRWVAKEFSISTATLSRHRSCMAGDLRPADTTKPQDTLLDAADRAINELQRLSARVKRGKNAKESAELMLKVSRELRSWFSLRFQLASRAPATPLVKHDTEVPEDRLESMAAAFLSRKKEPNK
jgi:hypothetical protein